MLSNSQFLADLVTFNEEILNGKLHLLCSVMLLNDAKWCQLSTPILRCVPKCSSRRCSIKKLFWNYSQKSQKLFWNCLQNSQKTNCEWTTFWWFLRKCFPVILVKFFRDPSLRIFYSASWISVINKYLEVAVHSTCYSYKFNPCKIL